MTIFNTKCVFLHFNAEHFEVFIIIKLLYFPVVHFIKELGFDILQKMIAISYLPIWPHTVIIGLGGAWSLEQTTRNTEKGVTTKQTNDH